MTTQLTMNHQQVVKLEKWRTGNPTQDTVITNFPYIVRQTAQIDYQLPKSHVYISCPND